MQPSGEMKKPDWETYKVMKNFIQNPSRYFWYVEYKTRRPRNWNWDYSLWQRREEKNKEKAWNYVTVFVCEKKQHCISRYSKLIKSEECHTNKMSFSSFYVLVNLSKYPFS